jgi:signal transduction histidine kinase
MIKKTPLFTWNAYKKHVSEIVLPDKNDRLKDVDYWRDEIFVNILTFLAPASIFALIPSIYMCFVKHLYVVGFTDLTAFLLVISLITKRNLSLRFRKSMLILIIFSLGVILLYYLGRPGAGLLYLLAATIFASIIYSTSAGYYATLANAIICIFFTLLIYFKADIPFLRDYSTGSWIAISSNLVLLSLICAKFLKLLLSGLEKSLNESKSLAANLTSIIENTDSFIYSLDTDLRYITFNQGIKNSIFTAFQIHIKTGDVAYDFLKHSNPEEFVFWKETYYEALKGKTIQFEKDFTIGNQYSSTSFSINPIFENGVVSGLSCFVTDITKQKLAIMEREKLTADLLLQNKGLEQFSYIISHNLRGPVVNIMSIAESLKASNDQAERTLMLSHMGASVHRLDNVISDLNHILQVKNNISEKKQEISFSRLVEDITISIDSIIKEENVSIVCDFSAVNNYLTLKSYLYSVFYNLISNSIKYRRAGVQPLIEISSSLHNNKITLLFKDNGLGIDLEKKRDKVFALYHRFHSHVKGKGMGLYMTKLQVDAMGGSISVSSEVNTGTTFTVEFETSA